MGLLGYSNSTTNRGTGIAVDQFYSSTNGDVALVHLSQAKNLGSYPALADSYTAKAGDQAVIMGYGHRANGANADGLYQANVKVLGSSTDAYDGTAVHIQGVNGGANHGDSGGPIIIGGKIVGVASTVDAEPGASTTGKANYANLTDSRQWISDTSGV